MVDAEDVQAAARPLTNEGERDVYLEMRRVFEQGPVECGRVLPELLLSNPQKGDDGKLRPFYYQVPIIGHVLFGSWPFIDALFPTGMGKTFSTSAGMALRMFFGTENAVVIAPSEAQTKFIRDEVHRFFEFGHPILRAGLRDSPMDEVRYQRPNGEMSTLFCRTANLNNEGRTLLGIQGCTTIILDERAEIPDDIFSTKIDRITPPQGRDRLLIGITTTHTYNHVYTWTEAERLPRREKCDATKPHITKIGGAVFKATWRDGQKAGRKNFDPITIDRRFRELGQERFSWWYESEWPMKAMSKAFPPDLLRSMIS